jgi:hypothetical protein
MQEENGEQDSLIVIKGTSNENFNTSKTFKMEWGLLYYEREI